MDMRTAPSRYVCTVNVRVIVWMCHVQNYLCTDMSLCEWKYVVCSYYPNNAAVEGYGYPLTGSQI